MKKPSKKRSQPEGVTLDCACVHCDYYQDGIRLGYGMMDEYYYFPAFHTIKRKVVQINIYKFLKIALRALPESENPELARIKSLNVVPYFEKGMFKPIGSEMEILSKFPLLQAKFNYCPQCGKFGLQFCLEEHLRTH